MQTEILHVTGMTTEDCTETVMRALKTIDGVSNVSVSFPQSRAIVQFDDQLTATQEMKAVLAKAGYGVKADKPQEESCGGCCGRCST
ncbi:hypothetical protein GCM10027343_34300 [Noviherbaspirillum agri]